MIQSPPAFYSVELFVEHHQDFETDFECAICHNVQKDPVLCKRGHGYCRSCISKWKNKSTKCPVCNETLDILVPNRDAERSIAESLVYCYTRLPELLNQEAAGPTMRENGSQVQEPKNDAQVAEVDHCMWTGKLKDANTHFRVCDYAGVVCSLEGCGVVVARKDKTQHEATCDHRKIECNWKGCDVKLRSAALALHELECPQRVVTCPNAGCGSKGTFANLATHRGDECLYEEVACAFVTHGCTARMLRKDVDSHEDTAAKQHLRLVMKSDAAHQQLVVDQKRLIDEQQQAIEELRQAHESLKHHVMPVKEIIVFQVKYDELTGKVPFVPRYPDHPTKLYSKDKVVRGYKVRIYVETRGILPEYLDYFGVYLSIIGGPFPCKVQYTFELVHHDWNPLSANKQTNEVDYTREQSWGMPQLFPKARLAFPDNNPYVKDGYVTFKCTFKFV